MASGIKFMREGYESWECPVCKKDGEVFYEKDASIEDVLASMLEEHRKLSPKCNESNVVLKDKALGLLLSL